MNLMYFWKRPSHMFFFRLNNSSPFFHSSIDTIPSVGPLQRMMGGRVWNAVLLLTYLFLQCKKWASTLVYCFTDLCWVLLDFVKCRLCFCKNAERTIHWQLQDPPRRNVDSLKPWPLVMIIQVLINNVYSVIDVLIPTSGSRRPIGPPGRVLSALAT